ncbi:MAG: T9SS type A sorting domain-containing protein [Flavobacteriales bacterium]|nr:T9SS type A sorting domain-containing protein [Flavobacteriales bacterium]
MKKNNLILFVFIFSVISAFSHDKEHHDKKKDDKQVNKLGSEIFADAPWRMNKFDINGNVNSVPIHVFAHDASSFGYSIDLEAINIRIKNASDTSFGNIFLFDTLFNNNFQQLFVDKSIFNSDLDIQDFDSSLSSSSSNYSIAFNSDTCSWFSCTYTHIDAEYWYFTFMIHPNYLIGFDDVIDIDIEFIINGGIDRYTRLRVFRDSENIPSLINWYRGDVHVHSVYTQNSAEIGLPLSMTKTAAKNIGLDWITTTDHTSDFDNYGTSINNNWSQLETDVFLSNSSDSSFVFIKGQEVAVNNSQQQLVHMLAYPSPNNPVIFPFLGDGHGDLTPTNVSLVDVLDTLSDFGGFAYAAHPFANGDKLPDFPINGGLWNLSDSNFTANDSSYSSIGLVSCNDTNFLSDVFSANSNYLIHESLKGGQIWNVKHNLTATGDQQNPWDIFHTSDSTAFVLADTNTENYYLNRFRQSMEVVDFINRKGLILKNQNTNLENWKFFYSAGSDAHGSFNYSNTDDFMQVGEMHNNALGKLTTLVYSEQGMGNQGSAILKQLKNGHAIISDGPLVEAFISLSATQNKDLIIGEDSVISWGNYKNSELIINVNTTSFYGSVEYLKMHLQTANEKYSISLNIQNAIGLNQYVFDLSDIIDSLMINEIVSEQWLQFSFELKTKKQYQGVEHIHRLSQESFYCFTNPIWMKVNNPLVVQEFTTFSAKLYPNPSNGISYLELNLNRKSVVTIQIFNELGQLIDEEYFNNLAAGNQLLFIDVVEKGIYFVHLKINDEQKVLKLLRF